MKTLDVLVDLQRQAATNHAALVETVNHGFSKVAETMAAHALDDSERFAKIEKRLQPVEEMRRTVRWALGVGFAAVLTGMVDFFVNHAHHGVK